MYMTAVFLCVNTRHVLEFANAFAGVHFIYYIFNLRLWLDFKVLLRTFSMARRMIGPPLSPEKPASRHGPMGFS